MGRNWNGRWRCLYFSRYLLLLFDVSECGKSQVSTLNSKPLLMCAIGALVKCVFIFSIINSWMIELWRSHNKCRWTPARCPNILACAWHLCQWKELDMWCFNLLSDFIKSFKTLHIWWWISAFPEGFLVFLFGPRLAPAVHQAGIDRLWMRRSRSWTKMGLMLSWKVSKKVGYLI